MKRLSKLIGATVAPGLLALAIFLLLWSCSSFGGASESAAYEDFAYVEAEESGFVSAPAPVAERSMAADQAVSGMVLPAIGNEGPGGSPIQVVGDTESDDGSSSEESEPVERKRVYSAELELIVASVESARDQIITIVETSGGYVESSRADYLVVRVPALLFDPVLESIEDTGDLRSRSVRTSDVTDQYFDLERRLGISEAARDRLLDLLERAEDPDERVAILRDIRRLTEEIEQLRSTLESLDQLIRFSRITIQLVSRIQISQIGRQEIPFWWIAALSPLSVTTYSAGADIQIVPDESFAVFESGQRLFAEAADGTQFRAGAVVNTPLGDADFWQEALIHHQGPFYQSATRVEAGDYLGVQLESKDSSPFYYLVLVQSNEDELVVVEVFLPHEEARDARLDQILAAIAGGAQ